MKVLITGGTGFIGAQLADHLLRAGSVQLEGEQPRRIEKIVLFDAFPGERQWHDPRIKVVTGDICNAQTIALASEDVDLVWHLAAVVSAQAESDFDLGMQVNVKGLWNLLEALRGSRVRVRLVNASGFAVFGGDLPEVVTDQTAPLPTTSYGMQKAVGELLVADYARKGFVDGRSLRLPTIVVRPGKPNKAASTFVSSIIREPLAGQTAICPVRSDTLVYISSPRRALESMLHAMSLSEEKLGLERTIPLPGITVSVGEMVSVLERVAGPAATKLILWEPNAEIQRIVSSWPARVEAARATALGFRNDADFETIVRAHIEDESVPRWWLR
jgi:nucleoside-diphosphate-sugar epimerase